MMADLRQRTFHPYLVILLVTLTWGCGAKTGLLIPADDADVPEDAETDVDVEPDVEICVEEDVRIDRRRSQLIFVLDRSSSMAWTFDDHYPEPGELSRWQLLQAALSEAIFLVEDYTEFGAEFYPIFEIYDPFTYACDITPGIDIAPGLRTRSAIMEVFDETYPTGGTPTFGALVQAQDYFARNERPGIERYIVLATDGGPNCRDEPPDPLSSCICTGPPDVFCSDVTMDWANCLDDDRTLGVVRNIYDEHDIPVYIVGIEDPTRPDLSDFLDEMAVVGGRPRPESSERRFYSVRRPDELEQALTTIVESTAVCVFVVTSPGGRRPDLEITVDRVPVDYDPSRTDGWDWTNMDSGLISFYGRACELAAVQGAEVDGIIPCDP